MMNICKNLHRIVLLLFLWCGAAWCAEPSPSGSVLVEIVGAEFGLFDAGANPDETVFTPSLVVPHRQGQRYGWVINVRNALRAVSVREEYVISSKGGGSVEAGAENESLSLPALRRNQVSQRQLVPVEGKIYGEWAIGPTEPAGHRRLQVVIQDRVVANFEFDVR